MVFMSVVDISQDGRGARSISVEMKAHTAMRVAGSVVIGENRA